MRRAMERRSWTVTLGGMERERLVRLRAAVVAGEAYIGHHAPRPFRDNAGASSTVTIEHGRTYRTCAPDLDGRRAWCVIVTTGPAAPLVRFAGNEPNSSFAPIRDL